MILSKPFSSFQVDSLSKRWAAALLLLFAWGVSFVFLQFPPGNPDFSQLYYWYEDLTKANDTLDFYKSHPFYKAISVGNLIYFGCTLLYIAFMHMVGLFYYVMYVCDLRKVPLSKAPKIYFSRVWRLAIYSLTLCLPGLIGFAIVPFIYFFAIPAFYIRSGLVLFEKQDVYKASINSGAKTRGHKLSIFCELVIIGIIYFLIHSVIMMTLNSGSSGLFLVESFLRAYIVLVIFRNMGTRFHMITVLNH